MKKLTSPMWIAQDEHTIQIINDQWVLDGKPLKRDDQIAVDFIVLKSCSNASAADNLETACADVYGWFGIWSPERDTATIEEIVRMQCAFKFAARFVRRNYYWE